MINSVSISLLVLWFGLVVVSSHNCILLTYERIWHAHCCSPFCKFNLFDHFIICFVGFVIETKLCTLGCNLSPSWAQLLLLLIQLEILFHQFMLHILLVFYQFQFHFSDVSLSFFFCFSVKLFNHLFPSIWVTLQSGTFWRCTQRFPVQLSKLFKSTKIIFLESYKLFADNLKLMTLSFFITGSEKEDKSFSLLWR